VVLVPLADMDAHQHPFASQTVHLSSVRVYMCSRQTITWRARAKPRNVPISDRITLAVM
jgi:hypothetical protein